MAEPESVGEVALRVQARSAVLKMLHAAAVDARKHGVRIVVHELGFVLQSRIKTKIVSYDDVEHLAREIESLAQ